MVLDLGQKANISSSFVCGIIFQAAIKVSYQTSCQTKIFSVTLDWTLKIIIRLRNYDPYEIKILLTVFGQRDFLEFEATVKLGKNK